MLQGADIRLNGYKIKKFRPDVLAAAPATPVDGETYYRTGYGLSTYVTGGWKDLIYSDNAALTNSRTPTGTAGGDLSGTYPNPVVANLAITDAKVAAANKDGVATTPSMRTLGTGAQQAAAGNDSRFGMASPPNGAAGGALTGTYPNPTLATNALDNVLEVATLLRGAASANSGTATDSTLALRALGFSAGYALPGNARIDQIAVPTTATSMNNQRQMNLADPINPQDSATKNYVDNVVQGIDAKQSVAVATTANITLSGLQAIDGYTVVAGDRVLVKDQSTASQNGIYVASSGAWVRGNGTNSWTELMGAFTFVERGTLFHDTGWLVASDPGGTLGTTDVVWVQFSSAGVLDVVSPLVKFGGTIQLNYGNGLALSGNSLVVGPNSVTNGMLGVGSVDLATNRITGVLPVANGGTGGNTAAAARAALFAAGKVLAVNSALTADTWSSIVHSLSNPYPTVQVYDSATGEQVEMDVRSADANTIQIRSGSAYAAATLYIIIIG